MWVLSVLPMYMGMIPFERIKKVSKERTPHVYGDDSLMMSWLTIN